MLHAVPDHRDVWDRLDDETEDEYALFWLWVGKGTPRLQGEILSLARAKRWAERAGELQDRISLPAQERDLLTQTRRSMMRTLYWGQRALEQQARTGTWSSKDQAILLQAFALLDAAEVSAEASTIQLGDLPDSALEEIERAIQICEPLRKRVA